MSPHLPSYQTFINFIMSGLQTDISPLTDALWWHSVLVLFLDDSELPVVPANWRETLEFVCQTKKALVVSGGNYPLCYFQRRFSFFFLHKRTSLWRKHIDYSLERFTLYTFSFTWTSLLMLQHQMFASVVAKLVKYLSKVVGLYQNRGASIKKHFSCGWIDFSALIWSECWHLIHRCVFKSCPVSCIDSPHCRHFDLSLQRQHSSN